MWKFKKFKSFKFWKKKKKFKYDKNYFKSRLRYKKAFPLLNRYNFKKDYNIYRYSVSCIPLMHNRKMVYYFDFFKKIKGFLTLNKSVTIINKVIYNNSLNIYKYIGLNDYKSDYFNLLSSSLLLYQNNYSYFDINKLCVSFYSDSNGITKFKYYKNSNLINKLLLNNTLYFLNIFKKYKVLDFIYYNNMYDLLSFNILNNLLNYFYKYIILKYFKYFNIIYLCKNNHIILNNNLMNKLFKFRDFKIFKSWLSIMLKKRFNKRFIMKEHLLKIAYSMIRKGRLNVNILNNKFFEYSNTNNFKNLSLNYKIKFNLNKLNLIKNFKRMGYSRSSYYIFIFLKKIYMLFRKLFDFKKLKIKYKYIYFIIKYIYLYFMYNFRRILLKLTSFNFKHFDYLRLYIYKKFGKLNIYSYSYSNIKKGYLIYLKNYCLLNSKNLMNNFLLNKFINLKKKNLIKNSRRFESRSFRMYVNIKDQLINKKKLRIYKNSKNFYKRIAFLKYLKKLNINIYNWKQYFKRVKFTKSLIMLLGKKSYNWLYILKVLNKYDFVLYLVKRIKFLKFYFRTLYNHTYSDNLQIRKLLYYGSKYIYKRFNTANIKIIIYFYMWIKYLNSEQIKKLNEWFYLECFKSMLKYRVSKYYKKKHLYFEKKKRIILKNFNARRKWKSKLWHRKIL